MNTIYEFDTGLYSDSVEYVIGEERCIYTNVDCFILCFIGIFATATYQLNEKTRKRAGNVFLHEICKTNDKYEVKQLYSFDTPGILDMKWDYQNENAKTLAIADAEGNLKLLKYSNDPEVKLEEITSIVVDTPEAINLNLDWNNKVQKDIPTQFVCSLSNGKVATVNYKESELSVDQIWNAHELDYVHCPAEVWSVSYNPNNTNIIISGADDTYLKMWDIREYYKKPVMINKSHTAGVCTSTWNPNIDHCFATGSYDGYIRIFDERNIRSPLIEYEHGGGIWRLKWRSCHNQNNNIYNDQLCVAGMRAGFSIVDLQLKNYESLLSQSKEINNNNIKLLCNYMKQGGEELAYGVDWIGNTKDYNPEEAIIGSSAFYSHLLHVWTWKQE
ncbi:hypothetical protein WA158_002752 [Blastocystis sp. Blastoise]